MKGVLGARAHACWREVPAWAERVSDAAAAKRMWSGFMGMGARLVREEMVGTGQLSGKNPADPRRRSG
jgi:hypothetical protein